MCFGHYSKGSWNLILNRLSTQKQWDLKGSRNLLIYFLKSTKKFQGHNSATLVPKPTLILPSHTETEASVLTHFVFRNFSLIPHWDLVYVLPNESEDCLGFRALVTKKAEEQRDTGKRKEPKIWLQKNVPGLFPRANETPLQSYPPESPWRPSPISFW